MADSVPPPRSAPSRRIPTWIWIVLPLAIVALLYAIGMTVTMIALAFTVALTLLVIQYLYPDFAREAARYVLLLLVVPLGIAFLLTLSWVLPLLIFPIYLIVLFSQSPKLGFGMVAVLGVGLVLASAHVPGFDSTSWFTPDSPLGQAAQKQRESANNILDTLRGAPDAAGQLWNRQIAYATGTVYEGDVDANAQKNLGLRVGQPQVGTIAEGSPARFFTDLEAELLNDQELRVVFSCSAGGVLADSYIPSSREAIFSFSGTQSAGCVWDANSLTAGTKTLQFNATYDFRTLGYVESSFGYRELLAQLKQQNIDLASEYGINENPSAVYTNGPVRLGMGVKGSKPLPIDRGIGDQTMVLGITIDPNTGWATGGKISFLGDLFLMVPRQVELSDATFKFSPVQISQVDCSALPRTEQPSCDDQTTGVYRIDLRNVAGQTPNAFTFPLTIEMTARLAQNEFESFMGPGIATHLFRASLDYRFTNAKTATFTVQQRPGGR